MKIQKREVRFLQNGTAISQIAKLLTYECLFLYWCVPAFEQLRFSLSCLDSLILCKNVIRIVVFLGLGVGNMCASLGKKRDACLRFSSVTKFGEDSYPPVMDFTCSGCQPRMKSAHRMIKHKNIVLLNITDAQMRELLVQRRASA